MENDLVKDQKKLAYVGEGNNAQLIETYLKQKYKQM